MGNTPTCVDCSRNVPKTVRFFDNLPKCNGRKIYGYFTDEYWTKLSSNKYLCPYCLTKRQESERQEEENRQRENLRRARKAEAQRREFERQQRIEADRKRIENERRREHERQLQIQEQRRRETERQRLENERREMENQRIQKERQEMERRHIEEQRREMERRRIEEQRREMERRRIEEQGREMERRRIEEQRREMERRRIEEQRREMERRRIEEQGREMERRRIEEQRREVESRIEEHRREMVRRIEEHRREMEGRRIGEPKTQIERRRIKQQRREMERRCMEEQKRKMERQHIENQRREMEHQRIQEHRREKEKRGIEEERREMERRCIENQRREMEKEQRIYKQRRETEGQQRLIAQQILVANESSQHETKVIQKVKTFDNGICHKTGDVDSWIGKQKIVEGEKCSVMQAKLISPNLQESCVTLSKPKERRFHLKCQNSFEMLGNVELENGAKNIDQIVKEMEMQQSKTYNLQSSRLQKVWTSVRKKLTHYGYPKEQRPKRNVNLSVFQSIGSVMDIDSILDDILPNCIAEIFLGVYISKQFWPRITQYTSLFYLIEAIGKGQLLEINTGEGKTCIIAMFAVYLAMTNQYVDIVSSSAVLAQRDSDEWKCFYDLFKLSSGSNLTQTKREERLESYNKRIIYGTVSSFASDILRQEFLLEDTRGSRRFDAVIVDEVDCLLLDNGVNFTYLSSAAPGMHHLEPIMLMIWAEIVRHPMMKTSTGDMMLLGKPEPVHVLLAKLFPELPDSEDRPKPLQILYMLEQADILRKNFTVDFMNQNPFDKTDYNCFKSELNKPVILNCLRFAEKKSDYVFQVFQISDENIIQMLNAEDNEILANTIQLLVVGEGLVCRLYPDKDQLFALIREKINGFIQKNEASKEIAYEIPSYLLEFVNNRMSQWIENAFLAKCMTPGREYIVDDKDIVPVDFESTGVVEHTKWGDGLHQFLEVKHNKKLSPMTLVTNFMSNQAFFKRYPRKIYGVSGTLGGDVELLYLQNYFELTCLKIPTHLQKKFVESPGLVCSCKNEWIECIQKVVHEHVSGKLKRAVLVVCEDINTAEEISKAVQNGNENSVSLLTRNDQEDILDKKFLGGDVIVATNIAGRGTDVEISHDVIRAGDCLSWLPFCPRMKGLKTKYLEGALEKVILAQLK